jgi:hypothetical protein
MSKFLLNLLLQISKALVNSKIQFLFEKNFSSEFSPPGPASPVLARSAPQAATRARSAHPGLRGLVVFAKSRLFFEFAQPDDDAFFLCHCHEGPPISFVVSPASADLKHASPCLTAIDHPAPPGLHHCDANQSPLLPRLDSPS